MIIPIIDDNTGGETKNYKMYFQLIYVNFYFEKFFKIYILYPLLINFLNFVNFLCN